MGQVFVNMVRPHLLDEDALRTASGGRRKEIAKALTRAGVTGSAGLVRPLVEQAAEHAQRVGLEREQRAVLAGLGLPTTELPLMGEGVNLSGLYDLAAELRKQGVGDGAADAAEQGPGGGSRRGSGRGTGS